MELRTGRPADWAGRLEKEQRVYDLLEKLEIPFVYVDHPAAATMDDLGEADAVLGAAVCKNLLLCNRQCTEFYLLMIPGEKPFKTGVFSRMMGSSRLSFATYEDMERLLGLNPGAVSLMGLMNDTECAVTLYVDRALLDQPYFGMHPCVNTSSLCLSTEHALGPLLSAMKHEMHLIDLPAEAPTASTTEKE